MSNDQLFPFSVESQAFKLFLFVSLGKMLHFYNYTATAAGGVQVIVLSTVLR